MTPNWMRLVGLPWEPSTQILNFRFDAKDYAALEIPEIEEIAFKFGEQTAADLAGADCSGGLQAARHKEEQKNKPNAFYRLARVRQVQKVRH